MGEHTVYYDFCKVTYWKNHTASTADEEWDSCLVTPLGAARSQSSSQRESTEGV